MLINSIDLQSGRAVQLRQGKHFVLDGGDPLDRLAQFAPLGEVAVIDLDAALGAKDEAGLPRTNAEVIRRMLGRGGGRCRVGGGIRTLAAARQWLDWGASKVILGTAATPEILRDLPRERVIAALDCRDGLVVTKGWTHDTGVPVEQRLAELAPLVGGVLITFVEVEGTLSGLPLERVAPLAAVCRKAGCRLTVAGGVRTVEEIAALDRMADGPVDVQVGMAVYTGAIDPADAMFACLRSDRPDGLVPTVVSDEHGRTLGLTYSSRESLRAAVVERRGVYFSRSRQEVWRKGETSGDTQDLVRVDADCDRDALRMTVRPKRVDGQSVGFCHLRTPTCFDWSASDGERGLPGLMERVNRLRTSAPAGSYTARLFGDPGLLSAKLPEEAKELAAESSAQRVTEEAADVLYFLAVKLASAGVSLAEVEAELDRRALRLSRRGGDAKPGPAAGGPARTAAPTSDAELLVTVDAAAVGGHRRDTLDEATLATAGQIIRQVAAGGEPALRAIAERFGERKPGEPLLIERAELLRARDGLPTEQRALLEGMAERIGAFAAAQRGGLREVTARIPGGSAGHRVAPVASAGCYAPGGRYPLPSTVLMTAVTARAAGVGQVVVATPNPSVLMLAAAGIAGADGVLAVGGAQAIAAMAHGVACPRCDLVVGPGNRYVTAAKKLLAGTVGIDGLAGPSEVLAIADATGDARLIAADLLAQAEHDPDAAAFLVTTRAELVAEVNRELERQLADLPTAAIARRALANGVAVVVADLEQAAAVAGRLAPEHLQVMTADPEAVLAKVPHYGAAFLGFRCAEVFGDYGLGPNHTLPTAGAARFGGGLSVLTFLRVRTWMRSDDLAEAVVRQVAAVARLEGLEAHARAAEARLNPHAG